MPLHFNVSDNSIHLFGSTILLCCYIKVPICTYKIGLCILELDTFSMIKNKFNSESMRVSNSKGFC